MDNWDPNRDTERSQLSYSVLTETHQDSDPEFSETHKDEWGNVRTVLVLPLYGSDQVTRVLSYSLCTYSCVDGSTRVGPSRLGVICTLDLVVNDRMSCL